jgi:hypothetical protein
VAAVPCHVPKSTTKFGNFEVGSVTNILAKVEVAKFAAGAMPLEFIEVSKFSASSIFLVLRLSSSNSLDRLSLDESIPSTNALSDAMQGSLLVRAPSPWPSTLLKGEGLPHAHVTPSLLLLLLLNMHKISLTIRL